MTAGESGRLYRRWTVDAAADGVRLGSFLRRQGVAAGFVSHGKFVPDGLLVNGVPSRTDTPLRAGDRVALRIDDVGRGNPAQPADCGVQVVWEDEFLAVFCKPAGLAVHGSARVAAPTVASFAAFHWGAEQPFHPVNRLDRGTDGLMLVARCGYIHDCLRRQLHTRALQREYLAVCDGVPPQTRGALTDPIGPAAGTRRAVSPDGRPAVTRYELLAQNGAQSLLRLQLQTGRCHQIRVHCAAHGFPLCGDAVYGGSALLSRPALHSGALRFCHPVSGESLSFSAPLPPDLRSLIARLFPAGQTGEIAIPDGL